MYKLNQIAVGLFVVSGTAFDLIDITNSTRLSILYFSFMYLSFALICLSDALKYKRFFSFGSVMGMAFVVRIIWEFSKWNLPFEQYVISVNNYEKGLLITFLTIALLLIILTKDGKTNFSGRDN